MNNRPTVLEINTSSFRHNLEEIKKYASSKEIMPIIKANAYGTYINKNIDLLNEFNIVGVATTSEGKELRTIGYKKDIFILNQPAIAEIPIIISNNLTVGLSSKEFLEELIKTNNKVKVHLEIETGMQRTGITLEDLNKITKLLTENITLEGIYTHLSSADSDEIYTKNQLAIFNEAIKIMKDNNYELKYIHALASSGILNYLASDTNTIRPGLILYGYYPNKKLTSKINLIPIAKLKAKITFLKKVPANTSISYSRTYVTKQESIIATIPIGYADGLKRVLSNIGEVVIKNQKCPIVGNICMDSCMIDVTDINDVKVGDDVYLWDNNKITLEEIAAKCNTINYEILSTISSRVERLFIEK